jgi:hypothetical protein
MKTIIKIVIFIVLLIWAWSCAEKTISTLVKTGTYEEVINKKKKGELISYTTESGEIFSVGDTIILGEGRYGKGSRYNFIYQGDIGILYSVKNIPTGSKVIIKSIKAGYFRTRVVTVETTKYQGFNLWITNFELAVLYGEIIFFIKSDTVNLKK